MTKCDFCEDSVLRNGKLVCSRVYGCGLSKERIMEILKLISKINK